MSHTVTVLMIAEKKLKEWIVIIDLTDVAPYSFNTANNG